MSISKAEKAAILSRAGKTYHQRFQERASKRKSADELFAEDLAERKKHISDMRKKLAVNKERYEKAERQITPKSEFFTSIPDERTTVASLTRGGFQSPGPSPPTTPKHSGTLMRTRTPITLAPKVLTRGERKKKLAATKTRLGKTKRPKHIDISDASSTEEKDEESETESESDASSEIGGDYPTDQEERDEAAEKEKERKKSRARGLRTRAVGVSKLRGRTNILAMRAARAKQKKARQEFKKSRVNKRHKVSGHHPFVPRLQIRHKGPGQFSVRSTGVTPQIERHVKILLSRLKGKLFVNGKFTNPKRAFSVIIALLRKKQVIEIQIR